jgi:hypothetical protein
MQSFTNPILTYNTPNSLVCFYKKKFLDEKTLLHTLSASVVFVMLRSYVGIRVARWYVFKPKIQLWVNYGELWNEKIWNILHMAIWNILRPFCIPILWPFGNLVAVWHVSPRFGILLKEKSGNPGWNGS